MIFGFFAVLAQYQVSRARELASARARGARVAAGQ
jgi:hypothetical protein